MLKITRESKIPRKGVVHQLGSWHTLNFLPNAERPGLENVTTAHVVVVEHIPLEQNLQESSASFGVPEDQRRQTLVYQAAKSTSFLTPMAIWIAPSILASSFSFAATVFA